MPETNPRVVWRYTSPLAERKHALDITSSASAISPGHGAKAACGIELFRAGDWMGSGSQTEIDRLAGLPKCKRCTNAVGW